MTDEELREMFSTRLKKAIKDKGAREGKTITQDALGAACDVSQSTISLFITGKSLPNLYQLKALADYLGVSSDYLLGGSGSRSGALSARAVCHFIAQGIIAGKIGLSDNITVSQVVSGGFSPSSGYSYSQEAREYPAVYFPAFNLTRYSAPDFDAPFESLREENCNLMNGFFTVFRELLSANEKGALSFAALEAATESLLASLPDTPFFSGSEPEFL